MWKAMKKNDIAFPVWNEVFIFECWQRFGVKDTGYARSQNRKWISYYRSKRRRDEHMEVPPKNQGKRCWVFIGFRREANRSANAKAYGEKNRAHCMNANFANSLWYCWPTFFKRGPTNNGPTLLTTQHWWYSSHKTRWKLILANYWVELFFSLLKKNLCLLESLLILWPISWLFCPFDL